MALEISQTTKAKENWRTERKQHTLASKCLFTKRIVIADFPTPPLPITTKWYVHEVLVSSFFAPQLEQKFCEIDQKEYIKDRYECRNLNYIRDWMHSKVPEDHDDNKRKSGIWPRSKTKNSTHIVVRILMATLWTARHFSRLLKLSNTLRSLWANPRRHRDDKLTDQCCGSSRWFFPVRGAAVRVCKARGRYFIQPKRKWKFDTSCDTTSRVQRP